MADLKKEEVVAKVRMAPEQQYIYSTYFWVEVWLKWCIYLADDMGLGWDKVNQEMQKSTKYGWPMAIENLEKLGVESKDTQAWGIAEASTGVNAWPGYSDEILEYNPARTTIKGTGTCVVLEIAKKLGIEKKVDLLPWCASSADAYLRRINPKMRFIQTSAMCRGDEFDIGSTELTDYEVTVSKHSY